MRYALLLKVACRLWGFRTPDPHGAGPPRPACPTLCCSYCSPELSFCGPFQVSCLHLVANVRIKQRSCQHLVTIFPLWSRRRATSAVMDSRGLVSTGRAWAGGSIPTGAYKHLTPTVRFICTHSIVRHVGVKWPPNCVFILVVAVPCYVTVVVSCDCRVSRRYVTVVLGVAWCFYTDEGSPCGAFLSSPVTTLASLVATQTKQEPGQPCNNTETSSQQSVRQRLHLQTNHPKKANDGVF